MKFGKSLRNQIEGTLPDFKDKFLCYKDLKRKLKHVQQPKGTSEMSMSNKRVMVDNHDDGAVETAYGVDEQVCEFLKRLEDEIQKFNSFFEEKEEEFVIKMKDLEDRAAVAEDSFEEIMILKKAVDFHGEMIQLANYSSLNYTGLMKLVKKHDRRTGAFTRLPFTLKVLRQPFFATDLLNMLVKECEALLEPITLKGKSSCSTDQDEDGDNGSDHLALGIVENVVQLEVPMKLVKMGHYQDSVHLKSTLSSLQALQEVRSGSSTVSEFSLPPLEIRGLEDAWKKFHDMEGRNI